MAVINPIIFRLPTGIKDKYDIPQHQGIFDNDGISDRLWFKVLPEDYNAANPITKEIIKGAVAPVATITRLLIAKSTFTETLRSANAWGGFLTHTVLKKLRKEGYNGLFAGINIKPKPTIQDPLLNQDGGAKTSLIIPCSWHDAGGTISGFNY